MKSSLNGGSTRKGENMEKQENYPNLNRGGCEERASLMGKRSAESKRAKKNMQETVKALLDLALYSGDKVKTAEDVQALAELKGQNVTVAEAIAIAQIQKALKGDTTSASFVVSSAGEKPAEKVEVGMSVEEYVKSRKVKL